MACDLPASRYDVSALPPGPERARTPAERGKSADRVERESVDFHNRVAAEYERLAAAEPDRFTRLDASEAREALHHKVMARVKPAVDALS